MFDLKRPCSDCPFTRSHASAYQLPPERLADIKAAPAFQCHKTLDSVSKTPCAPQQCAGLMAVLHANGTPNAIMQVASRIIDHNPADINTDNTFSSWEDVCEAHAHTKEKHHDTKA